MTPPPPGPAKAKSGCLRQGCLVALVLMAGACGWAWWRITLPGRLAAATHERIRPGASLRDVVAVAEQYWSMTGSQCSGGIESIQVLTPARTWAGSLRIRREGAQDYDWLSFGSRPDLLRHFEERPAFGTCRRLGLTFLVLGVPPRTSFTVEFGEDGRVVRVTPPRSWD